MSILRLVRNFALLAVLALAAHAAAGVDKKPNLSCGAICGPGSGRCLSAHAFRSRVDASGAYSEDSRRTTTIAAIVQWFPSFPTAPL